MPRRLFHSRLACKESLRSLVALAPCNAFLYPDVAENDVVLVYGTSNARAHIGSIHDPGAFAALRVSRGETRVDQLLTASNITTWYMRACNASIEGAMQFTQARTCNLIVDGFLTSSNMSTSVLTTSSASITSNLTAVNAAFTTASTSTLSASSVYSGNLLTSNVSACNLVALQVQVTSNVQIGGTLTAPVIHASALTIESNLSAPTLSTCNLSACNMTACNLATCNLSSLQAEVACNAQIGGTLTASLVHASTLMVDSNLSAPVVSTSNLSACNAQIDGTLSASLLSAPALFASNVSTSNVQVGGTLSASLVHAGNLVLESNLSVLQVSAEALQVASNVQVGGTLSASLVHASNLVLESNLSVLQVSAEALQVASNVQVGGTLSASLVHASNLVLESNLSVLQVSASALQVASNVQIGGVLSVHSMNAACNVTTWNLLAHNMTWSNDASGCNLDISGALHASGAHITALSMHDLSGVNVWASNAQIENMAWIRDLEVTNLYTSNADLGGITTACNLRVLGALEETARFGVFWLDASASNPLMTVPLGALPWMSPQAAALQPLTLDLAAPTDLCSRRDGVYHVAPRAWLTSEDSNGDAAFEWVIELTRGEDGVTRMLGGGARVGLDGVTVPMRSNDRIRLRSRYGQPAAILTGTELLVSRVV